MVVVAKDTIGTGWQAIKVDTTIQLNDVFFLNMQTGFICGDNYLGKSTDGGLTWTRCIPDSLNAKFINLFFIDANNGWVSSFDFVLRTRDGGTSWQRLKIGAFDVQFLDANNGYIVTPNTGLFKTGDGGLSFQRVSSTPPPGGLFLFDMDHGWISSPAGLYKTNNGWINTDKQAARITGNPYVVQFTDSLHGWIAGYGGVYRIVNGGASVEKIVDSNEGGDVQFFDNNNGYIMTGDAVYFTNDGGVTKTRVCKMQDKKLIECHFTDIDHGWATGLSGYLYRYVKL